MTILNTDFISYIPSRAFYNLDINIFTIQSSNITGILSEGFSKLGKLKFGNFI